MPDTNNLQLEIPDFLSAAEVAERLGVSEYTVSRWIKGKKLRAFRLVNVTRISRNDFLAFISTYTQGPEVENGNDI